MKLHLCFLLVVVSAAQALGQTAVIRAGRLIDPEAGTAAPNQVIVVEGGKVKAVGTGERLGAAYRFGVPIAFGTDAGAASPNHTRGTLSMSWVDSYAAAGIPPRALLQMMTVNAARLLGVERARGALKPGMAADIIATPANPLEDIQALKRVNFVMKDGAVFRNESAARP